MKPVLLLNCVGLTPSMIGPKTPALKALADRGFMAALQGTFPAVTCSAQSAMLTGVEATEHGVVGNGWYFREIAEIALWRQSNHLVGGEKFWTTGRRRDPNFSVCNMFWWFNMYADVDWSLTPRPLYFADGLKLPGIYGAPLDFRRRFETDYPPFPLFNFWGPAADIRSSDWIVKASMIAMREQQATVTMVYVPHLDYDLQRFGPKSKEAERALMELDQCVAPLLELATAMDHEILVVSEYGIAEVAGDIAINRVLRGAGYLATVPQLDRENLDPGASRAFAVVDHQIAHVYVTNAADIPAVKKLLLAVKGIDQVLDREEQAALGVAHPRAGELVAIAAADRWFSYYFWDDDAKAPDYAHAVDIHRKPGYDPVELFLDPELSLPKLQIAWKVLKKKLGFRILMDVIPFRPELVKGSHGRLEARPEDGPILISTRPKSQDHYRMTDIKALILAAVFGSDTEPQSD